MAAELERPMSSLSISSSSKSTDLDWDHQSSPASAASASAPVTPSPRHRHVDLPDVDGTPSARVSGSRRPRGDLLRLRRDDKGGENGAHTLDNLHLTGDEERHLREALDNWVNGEDEDHSFHPLNDSDEDGSSRGSRTRSHTLNGDDPSLRARLEDAPKSSDSA